MSRACRQVDDHESTTCLRAKKTRLTPVVGGKEVQNLLQGDVVDPANGAGSFLGVLVKQWDNGTKGCEASA